MRVPDAEPPSRREQLAAFLLLALALAVKLWFAFHWRLDTDEPQHLHVVWNWTQGYVQYRDFSDNHMPAFHMLFAPALAAFGERANIVPLMRLTMIPLWLVAVVSTYSIGRAVAGQRCGLWSAVLLALFPPVFLTSTEFRTDVLWAALWLPAVAFLLNGRAFVAGLLLGGAIVTTQKTSLLLVGLAGALLVMPAWRRQLLALAAGATVFPAWLALYLLRQHALDDFWRCVIAHNLGVNADPSRDGLLWLLAFVAGIGAVIWLARKLEPKRAALLLVAGIFLAVWWKFSPLVSHADILPVAPLLVVLLAPVLLRLGRGLVIAIELAMLVAVVPQLDGALAEHRRLLTEVLALTEPGDIVVDRKGETIFRRRATDLVLEKITLERLRDGSLCDDIADGIVNAPACVAPADFHGFPPEARKILHREFLIAGRLRVAAKPLRSGDVKIARPIGFDVNIPTRYVVITDAGLAHGTLDGAPFTQARHLERGRHTYVPAAGEGRLALVWAQAIERGFWVQW